MRKTAKDILIKAILPKIANNFIKIHHYSKKVVPNSKIHFGIFYNKKLEGVMQFGSPTDKKKIHPVVKNTKWNGMLEINRLAFTDILPKNSESRALSICMKIIKKKYSHIEWILSYADATQCGDGTIYRAMGFVLTSIKKKHRIKNKS